MIAPAFTQRITPWRERMWNWKGGLGGENSLRALRSDAVEKRALRLVTDLSARGRGTMRLAHRVSLNPCGSPRCKPVLALSPITAQMSKPKMQADAHVRDVVAKELPVG